MAKGSSEIVGHLYIDVEDNETPWFKPRNDYSIRVAISKEAYSSRLRRNETFDDKLHSIASTLTGGTSFSYYYVPLDGPTRDIKREKEWQQMEQWSRANQAAEKEETIGSSNTSTTYSKDPVKKIEVKSRKRSRPSGNSVRPIPKSALVIRLKEKKS